jgi:hypothetical protein
MLLESLDPEGEIISLAQALETSPIRSPKRQRLSSQERSPTTSPRHGSLSPRAVRMSNRFLVTPSQVLSPSIPVSNAPLPSRLLFMDLPVPTEDTQSDPLPQAFSPHRKSQKFLPNGLAAIMRGHIVDATSTHSNPHRWSGDWRIRVANTVNGPSVGMTMISGIAESGSDENVLLVGKRGTPQIGQSILVKGVSWDMELQGIRWVVAVDWVVEN